MRAEIKNLFSLEIDELEGFTPPDPAVFRVSLRLIAGPEGQPGEESFDFEVCSPRWLDQQINDEDLLLVRHKLLMRTFDFAKVRRFVERYVQGCEGHTWQEVANKLARLGHWELEDYRERA